MAGPDFDGVIAFDEAHNAGNAVGQKGKMGTTEASAQAEAVVELQNRLPRARVVYVSATGATEVSNFAFANRLGLWGPGTAFASLSNFIAEMVSGGLATMELVARDMKQMGAYIARSLSFDGVSYSRLEHQLSDMQNDQYNRMADAWQVTLRNMTTAMEVTGAAGPQWREEEQRCQEEPEVGLLGRPAAVLQPDHHGHADANRARFHRRRPGGRPCDRAAAGEHQRVGARQGAGGAQGRRRVPTSKTWT